MRHESRERHHVRALLSGYRGASIAVQDIPDLNGHILPSSWRPTSNRKFSDRKVNQRLDTARMRELTIRDAAKLLHRLPFQQKQEHDSRDLILDGSDSRSVFESYSQSDFMPELERDVRAATAGWDRPSDLAGRVAGRVYEDIVFGLLSASNTQNEILLSPSKTFQVVKALAPDSEVVDFTLGLNGITKNRVSSVPDGLNVSRIGDEALISCSLEYSISSFRDWGPKQERFARTVKDHPELFVKDPLFIAVVPQGYTPTGLEQRSNVRVLRAPLTSREFGLELRLLMANMGIPQVVAWH